ncbi:MAG: hypothetical protein EHM61_06435 [Acidobacteria bacterium]|nr:MAG: hypothetical protein EHM61_06435 [Acidobacteriota bacterium]
MYRFIYTPLQVEQGQSHCFKSKYKAVTGPPPKAASVDGGDRGTPLESLRANRLTAKGFCVLALLHYWMYITPYVEGISWHHSLSRWRALQRTNP